jgi:hypothetical protein
MAAFFSLLESLFSRNVLGRSFFFLLISFGCSSCALMSAPRLQPEINSLVDSGQIALAADKIAGREADYGPGNALLYYLDRGMLESLTGNFQASIASFEQAKLIFDKLYTRSVSREAASWLTNNYALPYRGTDYEYVLVNIFQAMNYLQMHDRHEALVEARDLDSKFRVIGDTAGQADRPHNEDNGFARLFMGLLYRSNGSEENLNDALIALRQALALYDASYDASFVPEVLKEDLMALAEYFEAGDLPGLRQRFTDVRTPDIRSRARKSEVIFLQLTGHSPVKQEEFVPVPANKDLVVKIALPSFVSRSAGPAASVLTAQGEHGLVSVATQLGADIEYLAQRDLKAQKAWILSKGVLRPALKYLVEKKQQENIEKKFGATAAALFGLAGSVYNFYSERADLRSWKTLPAGIRVGRIFLDPGVYRLKVRNLNAVGALSGQEDLGEISLKEGEVRFIIRRAVK